MTTSKRVTLYLAGLLGVALLLFAAYTWVMLHVSYSDGERAGYLQKFSSRGWVCKTWEGEILLTSMPGAIPEKFEFSVRDDGVAQQLMAATGKRVVLSYAQHKGVPTQCFGETEYYITKVQVQP
ncbi:hypothetical protein D0T25_27970 [Duganella sp. BJB488]|uniref:hypothetical protein n=1 Tax=unclassified Duganella TaxID=2636909 RepID=UPI000E345789|nr:MULTISPECIES: hypothetical protein [unclassified Duganella]NVD74381.1 hypothetical protein [Duganella sp. BJB1802]RFP10455.1 hypothetical protein D0T26_27050 [Duganella sp. BJB489]RFP14285.1 hypothetical protein D0T25_27970 [Duganella sp. BJB488]RFP30222.1 hypothetical protein D0T24_28670 [Duganella sp. BJB480]